jgi:hypothetical protein
MSDARPAANLIDYISKSMYVLAVDRPRRECPLFMGRPDFYLIFY